jgi:hypothetical protein
MAGEEKLYWKILSQFTATGTNPGYHVGTALQNKEQIPANRLAYDRVTENAETSDIEKRRRRLKSHCVFATRA